MSLLPCTPPIRVLCVDDSAEMTTALRLMIETEPSMVCVGCLASANDLIEEVESRDPPPDVLILDASMPGRDPLTAIKELAIRCPGTRAIIFSGHDDAVFIGRALDAGAWACISKHDEPRTILRAVCRVAAVAIPP